jgi:protein-S-isoprenylcysteine O-methyltransferase Ste14
MDKDNMMISGYIAGVLLVTVIVPSVIYIINSLSDSVYRFEIIRNPTFKWIIIIILLVPGLSFEFFINSITSVGLVCAIFVFMLTVVVKMEEKRLLQDFGNQYEEYRKKVSMFILWFKGKIK